MKPNTRDHCAYVCAALAIFAGNARAQAVNEDVKLPLPAGISGGEQFGHNVAIEGDVVVVGSLFDDVRG
ncbi:MAG: hypothetical protein AAFY46_14310, partial [Planctomycetota bacterium]